MSGQSQLQELDPSPVESPSYTPNPEKDATDDTYFPPPRHTSTSTTLGLSSSSITNTLLALQKYSTVPPAVYLIMHYTNTAVIPLFTQNIYSAEKSLLLTRPYYQSFPLEPLLIFAPVATHVLSGLTLRIYRRRQNAKRHGAESHSDRKKIPWPKLTLTSALGYMLYPMLASHVIVNRITPLKVEGGSSGVGFRYFAHGIAKHPILANIGYAFMVSVASWHFVGGAAKYLKLTREYVTEGGEDGNRDRKRRSMAVNALSGIIALGWMLGGLGVIGRAGAGAGWEAKAWDEIYSKVPIVGKWM